tara:strand:- start:371 stop:1249 length:879 start_codon:yes stop_codon:yes gene_type:complete
MTLVSRLLTVFIVLFLVACSQEKVKVIEGSIYGTTYSVQFTENIDKKEIHTLVRAELDRIDMVFSTYKEDSEISKINYCRTTAECDGFLLMENTPSADEFKYLYEIGEKIYEDSNQAFWPVDVAAGNMNVPGSQPPIDLSAIGKGYAVDKIAELLASNGIFNYFIDIGGELSVNGTKFGELWTWGVNNPFDSNSGAYRAFSAPQNGISIATSGEYRNPGHIWNGTGDVGKRDAISVTVIGDNTTEADAWATAMYVLGIEEGLEIAEKEGLAVFFIKNDGKSVNSSEWSKIYP